MPSCCQVPISWPLYLFADTPLKMMPTLQVDVYPTVKVNEQELYPLLHEKIEEINDTGMRILRNW